MVNLKFAAKIGAPNAGPSARLVAECTKLAQDDSDSDGLNFKDSTLGTVHTAGTAATGAEFPEF